MLRLCRTLVLVAACTFELAGPSPAMAQAFNSHSADTLEEFWTKRRRRLRRIVVWSALGVVLASAGIIMILNRVDRDVARKAIREKQLERERNGIA